MQVGSKKTIDVTLSKIAELFYDEFHLKTPPFIALLNHKTQCFHYYGRKYYKDIIKTSDNDNIKSRVAQVIKKTKKTIQKDADILRWFEDESNEKTKEFLQSASPSNSNDNIDIFVDLLLNTPISRHYGVTGQTFHTRIPRFFYNFKQFERYGGAKEYVENDPILAGKQKLFSDIINTLENLFWEGMEIQSAIMAPIFLYGQMAGICFVANPNPEEPLSAYDYLRFLQLVKELGITLIKDAREYEFLSAVLSDLPGSGFSVTKSIFKNLPILYNITGACLKEKGRCSCLLFDKQDASRLFPMFQVELCNPCRIFDGDYSNKTKTISLKEVCSIHKNNKYLKPKSGLYVSRGHDVALILYFDFEEDTLEMYSKGIGLAMEDAFKLIAVAEENTKFHRGYGHDTDRFLSLVKEEINKSIENVYESSVTDRSINSSLDSIIKKIDDVSTFLRNRTSLMTCLFGAQLTKWDVTESITVNNIKDILSLFFTQEEIFSKFTININSSTKVYKPAIECILINLISNTYKHGRTNNTNIEISHTEEALKYTQSNHDKFTDDLPSKIKDYLNGFGVDYEGDLKGLGHFVMQWVATRFDCDFHVKIWQTGRYFLITKENFHESTCTKNNTILEYKLTFPEKWG